MSAAPPDFFRPLSVIRLRARRLAQIDGRQARFTAPKNFRKDEDGHGHEADYGGQRDERDDKKAGRVEVAENKRVCRHRRTPHGWKSRMSLNGVSRSLKSGR